MLFKTIHGSRLYGLAHEDSDDDFYVVVNKVPTKKKRYSKQSIVDDVDTTTVDMGTWLHYCEIGVPQALEAMFSQMAVYDNLGPLRAQYRVGTQVYDRYFRTIKSFALAEGYKSKRHALRLALNLAEMGRTGRFNPTLSARDAEYISDMAHKGNDDVYGLALCISW